MYSFANLLNLLTIQSVRLVRQRETVQIDRGIRDAL